MRMASDCLRDRSSFASRLQGQVPAVTDRRYTAATGTSKWRERTSAQQPTLSLLPKHRAAGNRNTETPHSLPTPPGTSATVTHRRYNPALYRRVYDYFSPAGKVAGFQGRR
jgi:hypothetical protein